MKSKVKRFIQQSFFRLGFFPPEAIIEPDTLIEKFKGQSLAVQEYHLKISAERILRFNAITYYSKLLKNLVPNLDLPIKKSVFTSQPANGIGESSLVTFRRVNVGEGLLFEKVYLNSYPDLQNVTFFNDKIFHLLEGCIVVPKIVKQYTSDLITITYFEFLQLLNFNSERRAISKLIELSVLLYCKSIENKDYLVSLLKSSEIDNYKNHFEYSKHYKSAHLALAENGFNTYELVEKINRSPIIITHGDLNKTNIYAPNIVIDWDTFGLYPLGFDIAFLYHRLLLPNDSGADFLQWLHDNYAEIIGKKDWKILVFNCSYFLYVFSFGYFQNLERALLERLLTEKLQDL